MTSSSHLALVLLFCVILECGFVSAKNLTCYQCIRNKEEDCLPTELLPCASSKDRCVTHMQRTAATGYTIKRECGLAPCSFQDDMINRGLGMDTCDQSRSEFSCIFCCPESGCNKSSSANVKPDHFLRLLMLISVIFLTVIRKFQPPYVSESEKW